MLVRPPLFSHTHPESSAVLHYVLADEGVAFASDEAQEAVVGVLPAVVLWSFGGIPAPFAGIFNATGSAAALLDPKDRSLGQSSGLLPSALVPSVPATNAGQYGYSLNVPTSPTTLAAAQAHLGRGVAAAAPIHVGTAWALSHRSVVTPPCSPAYR